MKPFLFHFFVPVLNSNSREDVSDPQDILSCKPEGDSKLTELRRQCRHLSQLEDVEEHLKLEAQQKVQDSEDLWQTILQAAEDALREAEVQYSLSRELESFWTHAGSTKSWTLNLQGRAESMMGSSQGSRAQTEERLITAQVSCRDTRWTLGQFDVSDTRCSGRRVSDL